MGYKVTLTETCDEQLPHIITNVETTSAVVQDVSLTEQIHQSLQAKQLLPSEHLMDGGFIDAELLVGAQESFGVTICGPVKKDVRWQANQEDGFGLPDFRIDWEQRTVTCPQGKIATAWSEQKTAYYPLVHQVKFKPSDCQACSVRSKCTRSKRGPRYLCVLPQAQHEALQNARQAIWN